MLGLRRADRQNRHFRIDVANLEARTQSLAKGHLGSRGEAIKMGGATNLPCSVHLKDCSYHAFGRIGAALSKKISVFQPSSLKVVPISPNASYLYEPWLRHAIHGSRGSALKVTVPHVLALHALLVSFAGPAMQPSARCPLGVGALGKVLGNCRSSVVQSPASSNFLSTCG